MKCYACGGERGWSVSRNHLDDAKVEIEILREEIDRLVHVLRSIASLRPSWRETDTEFCARLQAIAAETAGERRASE